MQNREHRQTGTAPGGQAQIAAGWPALHAPWVLILSLILASWVGGVSLLLAASVLIFPDLPPLPLEHLLCTLIDGGMQLLPAGLLLAIFVGGLVLLLLRRCPGARRTMLGLSAALPTAALFVPLATVPLIARTLGHTVGGILLCSAFLLSVAVGLWFARHASVRPWVILFLLCLIAPMWLAPLSRMAPSVPRPGVPLAAAAGQRVVLLGMDGATWSMMRPMMERGELPHIAALMERGAHAPLRSLEPTLSNRVWTSAATGVVPERHGITDFFFDRRSIRVPTIWDLVHQQDGRLGLFEYLVTDPPMAANGFVLPGWMAQNPTYTHPPHLIRRFKVFTAARHPWTAALYLARRKGADPRMNVKEFAQAKFKASAFLDLHARFAPDLAACIWYGTDRLGHKLWRYYEPGAFTASQQDDAVRIADVLPNYYREVDRQIGRVVSALDDGRTFFLLMSDHGMGPMDRVQVRGFIRGPQMLAALGLSHKFYVESSHSEMILNCRVEGRRDPWTVPRELHRETVEAAAANFREIQRKDTNAPLFEVSLMNLDRGDLMIRVADPASLTSRTPVMLRGRTLPAGNIVALVELSGSHRIDGILVLAGSPVRSGAEIKDPVILDVGPTILRVLGLPIAQDLDGRVLDEALSEAWRTGHPLRTVPTFGTSDAPVQTPPAPTEEQLEKLRSLGYIQ